MGKRLSSSDIDAAEDVSENTNKLRFLASTWRRRKLRKKSVARSIGNKIGTTAAGGLAVMAIGGALATTGITPSMQVWLQDLPVAQSVGDIAYRWRVKKMSPETFNIVVADLENDNAGQDHTFHIATALSEQLKAAHSESAVRVTRARRQVSLDRGADSATAWAKSEEQGRWLLNIFNGDVLVLGRVSTEPKGLLLWFVPKAGEVSQSAKSYQIANRFDTAPVLLPTNFGDDMASAIAAVALAQGERAGIDGRRVDAPLQALVPKLKWLIDKPPPGLSQAQMVALREAFAMTAGRVGDQYRNKAMLEQAVEQWQLAADYWQQSDKGRRAKALSHIGALKVNLASVQGDDKILYAAALDAYARAIDAINEVGDTPSLRLLWAITQSNRAEALRNLGEIEEQDGRVAESIVMFREALKALEGAEQMQWQAITLNHLGDALRAQGEQETGNEKFIEAEEAIKRALDLLHRLPPDDVATLVPEAESNLGDVLRLLGGRKHDADILVQSVGAYQRATGGWLALQMPVDWANSRYKQAMAEFELGQIRKDRKIVEAALKTCQEGIAVISKNDQPLPWAEAELTLGRITVALGEMSGRPDEMSKGREMVAIAVAVFKEHGASVGAEHAAQELARIDLALQTATETVTGSIRH
jgi:tetratricopeptide (TPR) repeat protein